MFSARKAYREDPRHQLTNTERRRMWHVIWAAIVLAILMAIGFAFRVG